MYSKNADSLARLYKKGDLHTRPLPSWRPSPWGLGRRAAMAVSCLVISRLSDRGFTHHYCLLSLIWPLIAKDRELPA
jgi:hypothetical protein